MITKSSQKTPHLKMVVYGEPGVGKTVFCSTAPDLLFLDVEAGLMSVSDKEIDVCKVKNYSDIQETFKTLHETKHPYKTVALDSLTEIQKTIMDDLVKSFPEVKRAYGGQYSSQSDWGANIDITRRMLRAFRDLEMNVIFVCLSQQAKDEVTGEITVKPAMSGKTMAEELCAIVDVVGYLYVTQEKQDEKIVLKRKMLVQPSGKYMAKDRSDKLPRTLENPTVPMIQNYIFNSTKKGGAK